MSAHLFFLKLLYKVRNAGRRRNIFQKTQGVDIDTRLPKEREISYISTVAEVENIKIEEFIDYLSRKPYSDPKAGEYFLDIGQILNFLPPKPARILDLGVGSGWTSEIFARCGYDVVGLDISPQMIDIAKGKTSAGLNLAFNVFDYEQPIPYGSFEAVIMYDSLHHSTDEALVLKNVYKVLKPGGIFLALEPGKGHSKTQDTIAVVKKYGTIEKDMPFSYITTVLHQHGFREIRQFIRLRQLQLLDLSNPIHSLRQEHIFRGLLHETLHNGLTSLIVAKK